MGQIRITGGTHRSRKITVEDQPGLRPTTDRIRETLFNWLGQHLTGQSILDLYAGSGILSFEAVSRGATTVTCVENNRQAVMQIKKNQQILQMPQIEVQLTNAKQYIQSCQQTYDLIFLDPPFDSDEMQQISGIISPLIRPDGLLYREYAQEQDTEPLNEDLWTLVKQKKAGQVRFELWQKQ